MRYTTKPLAVDAIQFKIDPETDTNTIWECIAFTKGNLVRLDMDKKENCCEINTPNGKLLISEGDYIVRYIDDGLAICKPELFEITYEQV